jgi:hypothetical protein
MNSAHLESLDLLRKTRGTTLELVRDLNQTQSDYVPAPGKWSIGEVLDHLLLAEKLYRDSIATLIQLEKAGLRPVISKSFSEIDTSIAYLPKSVLPFLDVPFTLLNIVVPRWCVKPWLPFAGCPHRHPGSPCLRRESA